MDIVMCAALISKSCFCKRCSGVDSLYTVKLKEKKQTKKTAGFVVPAPSTSA